MSTTIRVMLSTDSAHAHTDLDELARLLRVIAARLQKDPARYGARRCNEVVVDEAGIVAGAFELQYERRGA